MRKRVFVSALAAGMIFSACSSASPTPQPTPVVSSGAPTNAGVANAGATAPTSVPTTAPISAVPGRPTFTVQRGEIVDQLTLNGRIGQVEQGLSFSEDGILKEVYVNAGDTVEPGQILAELDNTALASQLNQAQAIFEQDRRAVSQAMTSGQLAVQEAEVRLDAARSALEEARRPAKPDELARARAAVQQTEADLQTIRNNTSQDKNQALREMETAVKRLQVIQDLYSQAKLDFEKNPSTKTRDTFIKLRDDLIAAEDAVSRAQIAFDSARSNEVSQIQRAEGVVDAAKADLDKLLAGPDPFDIATAEQAVRSAQIALEVARQSASPSPELAKQAARSSAEVERISQQIAGRRLIAPIAGQIAAIEAVPGMPVRAATPLMMIASTGNRELLVAAPLGTDANRNDSRLLVGQQVTITFNRYPDQSLPGVVTRVPGRVSTDTILPDTDYAIGYDPGDLALDIGDLAEISIVRGVTQDALWLPPQAVRFSRDRAFVIMDDSGEDQRIEVVTGIISPERVEIISGLKEGDVVIGEVAVTR